MFAIADAQNFKQKPVYRCYLPKESTVMNIVCWLLATFILPSMLSLPSQELKTLEQHFPDYQASTFFLYILYSLQMRCFHMRFGSHLLPLTVVGGRCLDFPNLSYFKLFLCSPAIHSSQNWRWAIKSSEDSFHFLILHGSNSPILWLCAWKLVT